MSAKKEDRFLIITGLSGSGKTCASRFLEDLGYYCIDNLPVKLIPTLVDLWTRKEVEINKIALVVDIRESGFPRKFPKIWESINEKINPTLIFIDASDATLIQRFSESRRPHPLSPKESVAEVVAEERARLSGIKSAADEVIDTTGLQVSELRSLLAEKFSARKSLEMRTVIISFGYKYGLPLDSDLVFDTRCLPNPFYIEKLRDKTGKSKSVKNYVLESKNTREFIKRLKEFLDYMMPCFVSEGKSHLTISIGCTGGKHRSVVLAGVLHGYLREKGYKTTVFNRDVYK